MASPFIGREAELSRLLSAVARSPVEGGGLFLLSGEAGIGKTRLAEEFALGALAAGARVAWGRCSEVGGAPAFWPWIQILRDTTPLAALALTAPWLAQIAGEPSPERGWDSFDDDASRFALFDAVGRHLTKVAAAAPLVLVVDDLHTADEPSLRLLEFLVGGLHQAAVVIVTAARDSSASVGRVAGALGALVRRGETLQLRGWGRAEVAKLAGAIGDDVVDEVHRRSGGNPFLVRELLRLVHAGAPSTANPAGVIEVVRAHVGRLPGASREVLELAAVIGRDIDPGLLRVLAPEDEVLAAVDAGTAAGLLVADGRSIRFSHILVRDALYAAIAPGRRTSLHRTVGRALSSSGTDRVEEAAHHLEAGGAPEAADYIARSARRAGAMLAHEESADRFERALCVFDGDDAGRADLLLCLGEAADKAGRTGRARQVFGEARSLALLLADSVATARAALGLTSKLDFQRCDDDAVAVLHDALRSVGAAHPGLRVRLLAALARALYFSADREGSRSAAEEAVALARDLGESALVAEALSSLQYVLWGPATVDARLAAATEILALAQAAGDRERVLDCHMSRLICHLERAERTGVERELSAFVRLAEATGQPRFAFVATSRRAMRAFLEGRYVEGEALAEETRSLGRAAEEPDADLLYGGLVLLPFGELARSGELREAFETVIERYGNPVHRICRLTMLHGEHERLRDEFESLSSNGYLDLPDNVDWMLSVALLADTAAELGDAAHAAVLYEMLLPYADRAVILAGGVSYAGSASYYLGRLADTVGRPDAAITHFSRAVAVDTAMGARPAVARALHHWGRVAHDDALADRGNRLAVEIGMVTLFGDGAPTAPAVSARLHVDVDGFVLGWGTRTARLPATKGLTYLAALVALPGREVHVLDLVGRPVEDGGPVLDERAKAAYRLRLADLQDDLDAAEAAADSVRGALARMEIEALVDQLSAAVGMGGRNRRAGSSSERARMSARRAIKSALDRVSTELPALGDHLSGTVTTGAYCCYRPDPRLPVTWVR